MSSDTLPLVLNDLAENHQPLAQNHQDSAQNHQDLAVGKAKSVVLIMGHDLSRLEQSVTQYPILESLAAALPFRDLYNLAKTSKTTWAAINGSKPLKSRTICDGSGIAYRLKAFQSRVNNWSPSGYSALKCNPEHSKQCKPCGKYVCNECRVHCYYSGNAFKPPPVSHGFDPYYGSLTIILNLDQKKINIHHGWAPPTGEGISHDDGRVFCCYLTSGRRGEHFRFDTPVSEVLDMNLGQTEQKASAFYPVIQLRKRWMCKDCYKKPVVRVAGLGQPTNDAIAAAGTGLCTCTLRKRFLDRWTCIDCAMAECKKDLEHAQKARKRNQKRFPFKLPRTPTHCGCGVPFKKGQDVYISCNWCGGEVRCKEWAT
ncbi:uncharacterized protein EI97DRAFT_457380 [Westerdykella ornata]|uniref:Uncharacterized protein n=1 Tax=Westerdykella ornata TaxID=318751 RepID=A0A6A6JM94_WESOR|nr:uncharacterized protein EI97DRAFT_457380 [Westerdykella ornata]KAF2277354.1 hypothetical protein EI97DRAFT_457380 [Westerdykella ornata]